MKQPFQARRERFSRLRSLRAEAHPEFHQTVAQNRTSSSVLEQCPHCSAMVLKRDLSRALYVCPQCGYHHPIGAYLRLSMVLDAGSFQELAPHLQGGDPLSFPGYADKLAAQREKTGLSDAAVAARGKIGGAAVVTAALDSRFLMGSMGVAVGETITLAAEYARRYKLPLIIFSASGGARMQEGILSLMQMAKTAGAITRFRDGGGLFISVLTHPTTGGVTASFASLGDIMLAEPDALIGFAGPRVIEQTIGQTLPEGFQRTEFQEAHGFVDRVVPRGELRATLHQLLKLHGRCRR